MTSQRYNFVMKSVRSLFHLFAEYIIPKAKTIQEYHSYIDNLPLVDTPEVFGLHTNADITYQVINYEITKNGKSVFYKPVICAAWEVSFLVCTISGLCHVWFVPSLVCVPSLVHIIPGSYHLWFVPSLVCTILSS